MNSPDPPPDRRIEKAPVDRKIREGLNGNGESPPIAGTPRGEGPGGSGASDPHSAKAAPTDTANGMSVAASEVAALKYHLPSA